MTLRFRTEPPLVTEERIKSAVKATASLATGYAT
jgi:hypothetical protein